MFKANLKIAWRSITRNKLYTFINVSGLVVGICSCIVIYLISSYELSFDKFHPDHERIYRVLGKVTENTGEQLTFARLPFPLVNEAQKNAGMGESVAAVVPYNAKVTVRNQHQPVKSFDSKADGGEFITTMLTSPAYFDIFDYHWLSGNPATSLKAPYSVVLTETRARQYFGSGYPDSWIGKQIVYDDSLIATVSGIVSEWKQNTDLRYSDFISLSSLNGGFLKKNFNTDSWGQGDLSSWMFVKLGAAVKPQLTASLLTRIAKEHSDQIRLTAELEPLSNLHFNAAIIENPVRTAHRATIYTLIAVSVFILVLAIINFVNLSTAQSIRRAKEVGVRKVLGGRRRSLVLQFLTETFVLTFAAACIALVLVNPALNLFRTFIPPGVQFHLLQPTTIIILLIATIITTLLAGFYPAKILSGYLPVLSLKGVAGIHRENRVLRKSLIVFQFTVSLIFIIGSIVITRQLNYTRTKDLGFTASAIITIETPRGDSLSKARIFAERLKEITGVKQVAMQWLAPMTANSRGMRIKFNTADVKETGVTQVAGDENYIPLYQLKLLAGRNLLHSDSVQEFVINESLCHLMGITKPAEAIGKTLYWNSKPYPVVGVVADFHTVGFHQAITPLCIINRPERQGGIAVKLDPGAFSPDVIRRTLNQIGTAWKEFYPAASFSYNFYDETLGQLYVKDRETQTLTNTAMSLAIFISCAGLFGLALFTAERRAKEISIRKIIGASVSHIVFMLGKDFIFLIVIALLIASPIAGYFAQQWLDSFAYRIHLSTGVFLIAGVIAVMIAVLTIGYLAIRAAVANPVKSLRQE
ncbi:MAG: ABC transporter permease [Chitinophagaceae bacterium]